MNDNSNNPKGGQLKIDLPKEMASGVYSNFAIITHGSAEFVLDFAQMAPGVDKASVRSRVVMAPEHAKRLLNALVENIRRYESTFGPISLHNANERTVNPFNINNAGEA